MANEELDEEPQTTIDIEAQKYVDEYLPMIFKQMDDAKIVYNDEMLGHVSEDGFKSGFMRGTYSTLRGVTDASSN